MTREALTRGTELDRYVLKQVLHEDGRGISYLAVDTASVSGSAKVLVREYFPRGISVRGGGFVEPRDRQEARDEFELGLSGFIDAANALTEIKTHTLVPALNVVEENGTAYLVLEWPEGRLFSELSTEDKPMRADLLRSHLAILLPGLSELHSAGLLHTGLSPDTLIRLDDGYPAISNLTHVERFDDADINRTHLLLDSPYAAPELNSRSSAKIGPWTDIYSLSATCWFLLTGAPPPSAAARLSAIAAGRGDPLNKSAFEHLSEDAGEIADVLLHGLEIMPEKRLVSAAALAAALDRRSAILPAFLAKPAGLLATPWGAMTAIATVIAVGAIVLAVNGENTSSADRTGIAETPGETLPTVTPQNLEPTSIIKTEADVPTPQDLANAAWAALDQDDPAAVRSFMDEYRAQPALVSTASERLQQLDESAWSTALSAETTDGFETYLGAFSAEMVPPGAHAEDAQRRLIELMGKREFQIAEARRLLFAYGYKTNSRAGETPGLTRAVQGFQEAMGLETDGVISDELLDQLSAEITRRDEAAAEAAAAEKRAEEEAAADERFVDLVREAAESEDRTAVGVIDRPESGEAEETQAGEPEGTMVPPIAEPQVIYETKIAASMIDTSIMTVEEVEEVPAEPIHEVGEQFRDCASCPEVVVLPTGSFNMGSPSNERGRSKDESPVHAVEIVEPFAIGKYEVTLSQYQAFVSATKHKVSRGCAAESGAKDGKWVMNNTLNFRVPGFAQTGMHPVSCVSWNDAKAYTDWLSETTGKTYRLATEAEWEYAARGGSEEAHYFGRNYRDGCKFANGADRTAKLAREHWVTAKCKDGHVTTAPVGSFRANAFGLHDMIGNVWEWTEDCYASSYAGTPRSGDAHSTPTCRSKVTRGGSWAAGIDMLRSAARSADVPTARYDMLGFRVVRELPKN